MKIRNINILTDKQLENEIQNQVSRNSRATTKYILHFMAERVIPELQRLKADHWDKDAFDRLIDFLRRLKNENEC